MATKALSKAAAKDKKTRPHLQVAHRIEVLLHTMRAIERHEEQLCVVMTEIRTEGVVSAATRKELQALLGELPSDAYQTDLDAVEAALAAMPKALDATAGKETKQKRLPTRAKSYGK